MYWVWTNAADYVQCTIQLECCTYITSNNTTKHNSTNLIKKHLVSLVLCLKIRPMSYYATGIIINTPNTAALGKLDLYNYLIKYAKSYKTADLSNFNHYYAIILPNLLP